MERTRANLSMRFAILGSSSEIRMPATLVEIGLKLLLDFGSQVSMWLGPPSSQKRITALALPLGAVPVSAAAESACRKESPRKPSDPAVMKLRRLAGCCIAPPLMILREFAGADQGPDKFAQPGFAVPALSQDGLELPQFLAGGLTAERGQVELGEN